MYFYLSRVHFHQIYLQNREVEWKYTVYVQRDDEVVGHLMKSKSDRFTNIIFYSIRVDMKNNCTVHLKGTKRFIDILKKGLRSDTVKTSGTWLTWHVFCNVKKKEKSLQSCFKITSTFWTTVYCWFWPVTYYKTWFDLSRVKLYKKNDLEGNEIASCWREVRVIEGSSHPG